jgi:hypothetical protein
MALFQAVVCRGILKLRSICISLKDFEDKEGGALGQQNKVTCLHFSLCIAFIMVFATM